MCSWRKLSRQEQNPRQEPQERSRKAKRALCSPRAVLGSARAPTITEQGWHSPGEHKPPLGLGWEWGRLSIPPHGQDPTGGSTDGTRRRELPWEPRQTHSPGQPRLMENVTFESTKKLSFESEDENSGELN